MVFKELVKYCESFDMVNIGLKNNNTAKVLILYCLKVHFKYCGGFDYVFIKQVWF